MQELKKKALATPFLSTGKLKNILFIFWRVGFILISLIIL